MILYRLAGRTSARGFGLQWMEPIAGSNCAEVQKKAAAILKNCKREGYKYELRLQKVTIGKLDQAAMIRALEADGLSALIDHAETLEHWTSEDDTPTAR